MPVLRPSSPAKLTESESATDTAAAPSKETAIDPETSLPESYDVDMIRAMIQDPFHIYVYWEVRDRSFEALTRYFSPEDAATFHKTLRLVETEGSAEAFFEVERRGDYWLTVFPDREYEFEIGARSALHGYVALVRSNRLRTPRATVSSETALEETYETSASNFVEVMEASGFGAEQSRDITISALKETETEENPTAWALLRLPEPVRHAVVLAATGAALTEQDINSLPDPLRIELMKLFVEKDGRLASAGLMHYLPELLREVIEDDHRWIDDAGHPLRVAPRFLLGGTENFSRPFDDLRWPGLPGLPSSAEAVHGR